MAGEIRDYISGIEYKDGKVESIQAPEGRLTAVYDEYGVSLTHYRAEYWHRDHLGNTRLAFSDENHDGAIDIYDNPYTPENESEIVQENHYYPFGLNHEGLWYGTIGPRNKYQYNGKELNEDFSLNWHDFGARWQDPAAGRWWQVDPLARNYAAYSPYQYTLNNPIRFIDPDGRMVMSHDDYVYLNTKGKEIGRIKDDKVQQVIIIADENLKKFDDLPYGRESIDDAATMGKTYDLSSMLGFYNDNRSDYFDNSQPSLINASDGKAPKNIPVERAIPLYEKNGIVTIGKNEPVSKGGERVVGINPGQIPEERVNAVKKAGQSGFLHTEPINERNSKYMIGSPSGGYQSKQYSPNPSNFDAANYKPAAGFHSVIVRPKEIVFFTTKSNYFVVPKSKL